MVNEDKARLLLIEDDAGVRRSLQLLLHGEQFEVHAFPSAATALSHAESWRPTHAVIDYVLPDNNGVEVLRQLRLQGWTGPAALITAFDSEGLRKEAAEAGFFVVLPKPFADLKLVEMMKRGTPSPANPAQS